MLQRVGPALLALTVNACQTVPDPGRPYPLAADSEVIGELRTVTARSEDTLPDLARRYGLGFEEIVTANPNVDPWLPGAGTEVVLPTRFVLPAAPRQGIVVNLAAMRLFYFPPDQPQAVITYPLGIGRLGWSTPTGLTEVTAKAVDPPWRVPASIRREHARLGDPLPKVVPPGPDNPLGRHVLRLGFPSYLIHGTNKPYGVGMRVSHGCLRLYPEDIERLHDGVPLGTPVRIVNQPYLIGRHGGTLWLEAHPPLSDDRRNWQKRLRRLLAERAPPRPVDWQRVMQITAAAQGIPVPVPILTGDPPPDQYDRSARGPVRAAAALLRPLLDKLNP